MNRQEAYKYISDLKPITEKEKVYCRDCEYRCQHDRCGLHYIIRSSYNTKPYKHYERQNYYNKNNDCKDFVKKKTMWGKFCNLIK